MFTLTGSCVILENHGLTITRCKNGGSFLNFRVNVRDQYKKEDYHSFPCSMYVEDDTILAYWKEQLVPGRVFAVTYAEPKEVKYGDGKGWTKFQLSRHKLFPIGTSQQGE